jgi:hypothetical protein
MENTKEMDIPQVMNITKKQQVISILSVLSNCNQLIYKDTEEELQQNATKRIQTALQDPVLTSFIGNWELVWGPCLKNSLVKNNKSDYFNKWLSDNTMYVVKGQDPVMPSKSLYVVAVAGTNAISNFGWRDEDGRVETMVDCVFLRINFGLRLKFRKGVLMVWIYY